MLQRLRAYFSHDGFGPTLVRALAGSAGIRIVGMGLGFLVGVQLARGLGSAGYGIYGLAMSIISMVSITAEFGLPQLVTREVAAAHARNDWASVRMVLRWACRTAAALSCAAMAIGAVVVTCKFEDLQTPLAYALAAGALAVFLMPLGNIYGAGLRGLHQMMSGQAPEILLRPACYSALLLFGSLALPNGLSPHAAMALQVLSIGCSVGVAYLLLSKKLPHHVGSLISPSVAQSRRWLHSSWSMALTEAMRVLHGNISILMLGAMLTPALVGTFRVGSSTSALLTMPISLIHIVLAPTFTKLYTSHDIAKLQRLAGLSSLAMVAGVTLLTLPFLIGGEQLLGSVFGQDFKDANTALLLLSLGSVAGSIFGPGATLLNMTGHERRVARSFATSLIVLCILTPCLIIIMGINGAALANAITFVIWSAMMWQDARNILGVDASIASALKNQKWRASKHQPNANDD